MRFFPEKATKTKKKRSSKKKQNKIQPTINDKMEKNRGSLVNEFITQEIKVTNKPEMSSDKDAYCTKTDGKKIKWQIALEIKLPFKISNVFLSTTCNT